MQSRYNWTGRENIGEKINPKEQRYRTTPCRNCEPQKLTVHGEGMMEKTKAAQGVRAKEKTKAAQGVRAICLSWCSCKTGIL